MTALPTTQAELVRLALGLRPAPKPKPSPVNRDYWTR